jgi:tape measure domain-containing protein
LANNDEIGSLNVKVGLDGTGFQEGISQINRQLAVAKSAFKAAAAQIAESGSAMDKVRLQTDSLSRQIDLQRQKVDVLSSAHQKSVTAKGADAKASQDLEIKLNNARKTLADMENQLNDVGKSSEKVGTSFLSLGNIIKGSLIYNAVYAGINSVTSAFKNSIGAGIQYDSTMQQLDVGFTTLLGSASQAQTMLKQLADFAQATPFDLQGVTESAKQMLAMGFSAKEILPDMKAIGDAAAGLGLQTDGIQRITLALGQLRTHGVADAQDLLQLTEAGIPAWDILAKSMGKTVPELQKMVSKGLVPARQATDALIAGMEQRFPNMLGKLNSSFASQMGNMSDAFKRTFGELMTPTFNYLTNTALPALNDKLNTFRQTLERAGAVQAFKTIIPPGVVDTVVGLYNAVKKIFDFIKQNGPVIESILTGLAAFKLATMFSNISGLTKFVIAIKEAQKATKDLTVAQAALSVFMKDSIIGSFIMKIKELRKAYADMTIAQAALNVIMDANPIGVIAAAMGVLIAAGVALYRAWTRDWDGIREKTMAVVNVIKAYFKAMVSGIMVDFNALKVGVLFIINGILNMVSPLVDLIGKFAPGVEAGFRRVKAAVVDAKNNAVDQLHTSIDNTTAAAYNLIDAGIGVRDAFTGAGKAIQDTGLMNSKTIAAMGLNKAPKSPSSSSASDIVPKMNFAMQSAAPAAKATATKTAKDIVQAFIDGINSKATPLQQKIDQLKASLQFRTDSGDTAVASQTINSLIKAYQQELKGLTSAMSSVNAEIKKFNPKTQADDIAKLRDEYSQLAVQWYNDQDAIAQLNDQIKKASQDAAQKLKDAAQTASEAFKQMSDAQIQAFTDARNNELAEMQKAHQVELQSFSDEKDAELAKMQQVHQQALANFDSETQSMIAGIDQQIAALDTQQQAQDRASTQAGWDKQSTDLQHQLAVANLMGDSQTIDQVKQQIQDLNDQIAKQKAQWARDDQKASLEQQKTALQAQRNAQKQSLQQEYQDQEQAFQKQIDLQKQALQQQYSDQEQAFKQESDAKEKHLQALQDALVTAIQNQQLTQQQANAAWIQAVKDTGDQEVQLQIEAQQKSQKELNKWVQTYVDIGKAYGKSLGQGLVDGLNSMLAAVQSAAAQLANAASAVTGGARVAISSSVAHISVPHLADGAVLTRPTMVLAGEAGDEAVLPLNDSVMSRLANAIVGAMPRSSGQPINVYLDGRLIAAYTHDLMTGDLLQKQRKGV